MTSADRGWLHAALAFFLLLGSMPLTTAVLAGGTSKPVLTVNVCHLPDNGSTVAPIVLALPHIVTFDQILIRYERAPAILFSALPDLSIEPDSPPPEARA
jgi:hypothetical protein